jgi:hypothetical protein
VTVHETAPDDLAGATTTVDEGQVVRSERRRRMQHRRRRAGIAYAVAVALLAVSIPVLGFVGVQTILGSSDGEVMDPVLDPTEPGYRALIQPSPTMLLVHENDDGAMIGGALLSLAGTEGGGGSLVVLPPSLVGDIPDIGTLSLGVANDLNDADAARAAAEWILHMDVSEVVALSHAELAEFHAATGPLTIQNPDTVRLDDGTTFPAGQLVLEPDEIPRYSAHLGDEESQLNRLLRQQLVWDAWIEQISTSGEVSFPGEQDSGLARFLAGIVEGTHRVENVPLDVDSAQPDPGERVQLRLDEDRWAELLPDLVPFPAGATEGDRFIVRVLAGTEDDSTVRPAARVIVAAGGQVNMIGNADEFGHETTEIIYYDPAHRSDAEAVADALGFGTVTFVDEIDDSADVIVVLGADATS